MYSAEEVVELAIKTETNGKKFYEHAQKSAKDKELKELFGFLAAEEDRHRLIFETLRGRTERLMTPEDMEEIESYLNVIVESEFFLGSDKALVKVMDAKSRQEALSFALQFEKDTLLFYTEVSELAEGKTKDVLNEIIKEEKKHVRMISELMR